MYFFVYTPSNQHFKALNSIPRPVFFINFSRRIQISHLDSLYTTRASKIHAFCPHIFSILYSLRTISGVKLQLQWPRGTTCARKLHYTGSAIVQLDTY